MIGSFWNLCRACPSMPVDKLHSEYRSTYKWHEYTGNRQEVVRRPPQANASSTGENEKEKLQNMHLKEEDETNTGCKMEPAMPRRKKHPELAYRTHEFLAYDEDGSHDNVDVSIRPDRARHRGWGTELASEHISELYNKQIELWEQVSRRSSLSALSLASTTRKPYTKEEKEEENNKKSSPSKGVTNQTNVSHRKGRDNIDNSSRTVREIIRHHLERTTGGSDYDGLILSPTREKLEPTIPKRIEDRDHQKENQSRSSPKKDSPQKSKRASSKSNGTKPPLRTIRSQSVGPTEVSEKSSPKRLSRSTTVRQQKTPRDSTSSPPSSTVRRPRPSSLNTTALPRSKCSSVPPKSAPTEDRFTNKSNKSFKDNTSGQTVSHRALSQKSSADPSQEKCTISMEDDVLNGEREDVAHVVKSPPEPTRVKSPEQIMMRSPDPVNWTVPLDTGKTFTVTQNVRDGELMNRPHSEVKAWTPPDVPPPAALSAPPELTEQAKSQAWRSAQAQTNTEAEPSTGPSTATSVESVAVRSVTIADDRASSPPPATTSPLQSDARAVTTPSPVPQSASAAADTPIPHSTAEPSKQDPPGIDVGGRSLATDVFEKARNRFDEFWGKKDPRED